jgi:hypothetical protein
MSFVKVSDAILLFAIYNKGAKDNISDKEIREILKDYQH